MADFIAVIRRAVDGLSENTPEMRQKVYERAKSAVVRQLENMKPRPPEAMFQRQLDKLDSAIAEVESEHSAALPAIDESTVADEPVENAAEEPALAVPARDLTPEPAPVKTVEAEPVQAAAPEPVPEPAPQPVIAQAVERPPLDERPLVPESVLMRPRRDMVVEQPAIVVPASVTNQPRFEPAAAIESTPVQAQVDISAPAAEIAATPIELPVEGPVMPVAADRGPNLFDPAPQKPEVEQRHDDEVFDQIEPVKTFAAPVEPVFQPFPPAATVQDPVLEAASIPARASQPTAAEPASRVHPPLFDPPASRPELPVASADAALLEPVAPMPKVSYDENDVVEGFNDFLKQELNRQVVPPPPAKAKKQDDFSWDAPFDDLPAIERPEAFDKALEAKQKEIGVGGEKRRGRGPKVEPISARAELEELLGVEPAQRRGADVSGLPPELARPVSKLEGKTFKMQKKRAKRGFSLLPIALGIVGVLVLGGGAYAFWAYKDNISALVSGVMPASETAKSTTTAERSLQTDTKALETETAVKTDTKQPVKQTELASLNSNVGTQKFTQRLMPDGTETQIDTAKVAIDQSLTEGKTVANQTDNKDKEVASTTPADAKTDTTDTGQPQNDAQPLGATQKMFLYEERLGQTSPVAVPGTVVWREKNDTEDGKPNPEIEASLDVPDRKITAMITIKRNTDASLPASHIIEVVFGLPPNFEEGNVDSIQRVAFKQTEQDRGNPLIAVPAKITDDFHMVALNDDADARKVNLELMKTRGWIDIPITYRNGRRALITIEKGTTGTAVFDKVMAEWEAMGSQTSTAN